MDYDSQESEFATAVAAAAFAIHSMEQAELQYQKERRKSLEITRTNTLPDTKIRPSSGAATRRLSNKGANSTSGKFSAAQIHCVLYFFLFYSEMVSEN